MNIYLQFVIDAETRLKAEIERVIEQIKYDTITPGELTKLMQDLETLRALIRAKKI